MGQRIDENHDGAFGDECREEVRVILDLHDDERFASFWDKLRDNFLSVRRGIETSPTGYRLSPFDVSLTKRVLWLQRQVINPVEVLEKALATENRPYFAHWENYGDNPEPANANLVEELAKLKSEAEGIRNWLDAEIKGDHGGKIAHTDEIRYYVVQVCLWDLHESFPEYQISRGTWIPELKKTVGAVPDYVRRVFQETTGQIERLDGQIQEALKALETSKPN